MHAAINKRIIKVNTAGTSEADDLVVAEEPLEIRLRYQSPVGYTTKSISVTMRTPGQDAALAMGFLYTEGIIQDINEVATTDISEEKNVVAITLAAHITPDLSKLERNFYTTSSCGVCGKASIEAVQLACNILDTKDNINVSTTLIYTLPEILRQHQEVFEHTGGIHACALFDLSGKLLLTNEDAGRHNALDKLIGTALEKGMLPLNQHILLLSGRSSFELIQKSAMAGIKIVAAVGAPSSLAVQMAEEWGMTLIGFLRGERFNIYTGGQRIVI